MRAYKDQILSDLKRKHYSVVPRNIMAKSSDISALDSILQDFPSNSNLKHNGSQSRGKPQYSLLFYVKYWVSEEEMAYAQFLVEEQFTKIARENKILHAYVASIFDFTRFHNNKQLLVKTLLEDPMWPSLRLASKRQRQFPKMEVEKPVIKNQKPTDRVGRNVPPKQAAKSGQTSKEKQTKLKIIRFESEEREVHLPQRKVRRDSSDEEYYCRKDQYKKQNVIENTAHQKNMDFKSTLASTAIVDSSDDSGIQELLKLEEKRTVTKFESTNASEPISTMGANTHQIKPIPIKTESNPTWSKPVAKTQSLLNTYFSKKVS